MRYAEIYYKKELEIIKNIYETQSENIEKAAQIMADAITSGHLVHVFGSAHSAIPLMEIFPRYGSYVGEKGAFHPLLNPRLLWWNVVGTGGVKDLLWLERQKGYIANFLDEQDLKSGDILWVFSHGGINAAPVEAALYAKERGMKVVAVTSLDNQRLVEEKHPEIKKLSDIADITIDNCVPLEDALVPLEKYAEKVSAGSTIAIITIVQLINAQVAGKLVEKGVKLRIFVSPNVTEIPPTNNQEVFKKYDEIINRHKNTL
jgi:uncharacterized phosphosugar-binding protein